jgi:hypothetical protein
MNVAELAAKLRRLADEDDRVDVVIVVHRGTAAKSLPIASAEWTVSKDAETLELSCYLPEG